MRRLLLPILAALSLTAQTQTPTFRAGAALVRVDVQVVSGKAPVTGLTQGDFIIREEGDVKAIETFGHEAEPVQLVILLDVSGSMGRVLREMAAVAQRALGALQPGDQVAVAVFARHARVTLELTGETRLAVRALQEAPLERDLGAGTSINEAVLDITRYLHDQPYFAGRRSIVILTDNGGMHYQSPDRDVLRALSENDTVLNAIVTPGAKPPAPLPDSANPDFSPANVFRLAAESGGELLRADNAGRRFEEILSHLRQRYSLGIRASSAPRGTYRRLNVTLSDEARRRFPKAEIRARSGYFAIGD